MVLSEGPLPDFPHSMEPQLRKLGLPTSLQRGVYVIFLDLYLRVYMFMHIYNLRISFNIYIYIYRERETIFGVGLH